MSRLLVSRLNRIELGTGRWLQYFGAFVTAELDEVAASDADAA
jgi:hypothetical protein